MFPNCYIGAPCGLQRLSCQNEALNAKVLEEVSNNQELVILNHFEQQSSEYELRKFLEERISDLESWRWVLQDLSKRLDDLIQALRYEHKALRVVLQRVEDEIIRHSQEGSRPGALIPQSDVVENAVYEELRFLQEQKKKFKKMIEELDEEIPNLEKVKKRIEEGVLNKEQAIHIDENISEINIEAIDPARLRTQKKSLSPLPRWERQCYALKKKGLCALSHALTMRHQVRGCRALLSVVAQSYATRVDSLLKRRLYSNMKKLEDLEWQKGEAQQDYRFLTDELTNTERNILETMDKIRLMEARLADRRLRPPRELTKDNVDRKLKDELNRLKQFLRCLRNNVDRITSLQDDLKASIAKINCAEEDLTHVIRLDEDRIRSRTYEDTSPPTGASTGTSTGAENSIAESGNESREPVLTTIREEDEDGEIDENGEDDYPFDY